MYFISDINSLELFEQDEQLVIDNVKALLDANTDGYHTGLTWKDSDKYTPGGPWIFTAYYCDTRSEEYKRQKEMERQSTAENKVWRAGWRLGYEHRKLYLEYGILKQK